MRRTIASVFAGALIAASLAAPPAAAQERRGEEPPPPYQYWESRRDPPPGHEFRNRPDPYPRWEDRDRPPPNWNRREWELRQRWLRQHGHDNDDHDSEAGLIGAILGFALGAAVVDSQQQQDYATSRLNDPGWIAYCARRYRSFDPYTGTYLGNDGLRHYCR